MPPSRRPVPLDSRVLADLRTHLDDAAVREIVALYVAEAPNCLAALAAAPGQAERAVAAQRLRSAASAVGALEVEAVAREAESAATIDEAALVAAVERSLVALRAFLGRGG